jgi:hypothetical protein
VAAIAMELPDPIAKLLTEATPSARGFLAATTK